MKDKLIELIKKYRSASELLWSPEHGYIGTRPDCSEGQSKAYGKCADDLEKLVRELEEKP